MEYILEDGLSMSILKALTLAAGLLQMRSIWPGIYMIPLRHRELWLKQWRSGLSNPDWSGVRSKATTDAAI